MNEFKYAADIDKVKEVTLHGTADLLFWEAVLEREGLFAYREADKAVLLLSAVAAKWKGVRFKECVVAVGVCSEEDGTSLDGYYLPQAFNGCRLLALSERVFFRTPYVFGTIHTENRLPAAMRLQEGREVLLHAEMSADERASPVRVYQEWKGPIFLPDNSGKFFAVLAGETESYPFLPGADRCELKASSEYKIFQWLLESNFVGKMWSLRDNARHARSKTYPRASASG